MSESIFRTLPTRLWGVEIETCCNVNQPSLARIISSTIGESKVDLRNFDYHSHETTKWGVERDGSIQLMDNYGHPCEIISRPLSGWEGFEELQRVIDAVTKNCEVNRSCSLHVHVSLAGMDWGRTKKVIAGWSFFEKMIKFMVPPSRRNNRYCKNSEDYIAVIRNTKRDFISNFGLRSSDARYKSINLKRLIAYNILEFRIHSATIDYYKIFAWVAFLLCFVEYSSTSRLMPLYGKTFLAKQFFEILFRRVGLIPLGRYKVDRRLMDLSSYFKSRLVKFAGQYWDSTYVIPSEWERRLFNLSWESMNLPKDIKLLGQKIIIPDEASCGSC